jgi:hypothetical protein
VASNIVGGNGCKPRIQSEGRALRGTIIDCMTQVNVDVKNQAVRSILTDCLPISNDNAVLWRAVTTRDVDGKKVVTVQFSGQRRPPAP